MSLVGRSVGNFRVEERLGGGGMGDVYLLRHKRLPNTLAALKVLRADRVALPDVKERFVQEALVAAAVGGDRVARPIDIGRFDDGAPFIIFELAAGQTLAQMLASGPLAVDAALRVAFGVADTMALVHARGIVHRDLKPSNLMIDGDDLHVRLLDFGVARAPADLRLAQTIEHAIVGSPGYMSPEAAIGKAIDAKSDVFSLGATLYRCLTGDVPFPSASVETLLSAPPPKIERELPEGLEGLVTRMLAKRGEDRPTMADVRDALAKLTGLTPSEIVATPTIVGARSDDVVASTITLGRSAGPAVDLGAIREQLEGICNDRLPVARRPRTLLLVGGLAIVVLGVAGWMLVKRGTTDHCDEQAARMDPIWTAAARARFVALTDLPGLDAFAHDWRMQRVEACHTGNAAIRRTTCLDRAFDDFARIVERPPGKWRLPIPSLLGCANPREPRVRGLGFAISADEPAVLGPTANQIAFVRGHELRIAALDGTDAVIGDVGPGKRVVAWPTERRVILYDEQTLTTYDPQTKAVEPWLAAVPRMYAISPDAEYVVTRRDKELFVQRRNAPPTRIATLPEATQLEAVVVAPDGKHVAFGTWTGSKNSVVIINVATGHMTVEPLRVVVGLSGASALAWLDAERLVLNAQLDSDTGEGLLVGRVQDGRLREPLAPFVDAQRYTALLPQSPGGGALLAVRTSIDQRLAHIRNGEPTRLPHATQTRILTGRTDDGRMLVVRDEDTGWVTPDGQYTRVGTTRKDWLATDGKRVLFDTGKTLFAIDARGERRVIAEIGGEIDAFSEISCGSETCAVIRRKPTAIEYRILRGDTLDPPKTIALTSWAGDGFAMSPDGKRLALVDRSGPVQHILVIDLATGQSERWSVPPRTDVCGLQAQWLVWAADGALYTSMLCVQAAGKIYRVERGRDPVAVFSTPAWIGGFVVDRDGGIFANLKQNSTELVLIEGL